MNGFLFFSFCFDHGSAGFPEIRDKDAAMVKVYCQAVVKEYILGYSPYRQRTVSEPGNREQFFRFPAVYDERLFRQYMLSGKAVLSLRMDNAYC